MNKYEINQDFISMNRSNTIYTPKGGVVHSTATPGATDEREQDYYDKAYRGASAHAFVDWDSITQTLPWNEKGWHACEPANSMFFGIELCEPYDTDPDKARKFSEVWKRATWLFAYLFVNVCKIKTVTKDNLMSHHEISLKWHNTTHVDPTAFFKKYGKTVDMFRADVQREINEMTTPVVSPTPPKPTTPTVLFEVEVLASTLNCRETPSTSAKINAKLQRGRRVSVYSVKGDWYQINPYPDKVPQWINSGYTKRVYK
jgi:N-acetylmuramoyl-L-alanine amidase CwlA